ncbi:hypothetical protein I6E12_12000 [Prevotella brevis]|uniref:DUF1232 domain-containing protein n=1 Tax=Xylanibacter brevis TaxID=83231 RepID=A0ABS9CIC0_9BACT|nr:hypothetical protein [Xylanibacter brevis]MCF2564819.1 hypothetical protein [Xylanibacter brevis]
MNSMDDKKATKREKMMNMPSYRLMVGTAKYMDKWFLDPILGFILPAGISDALLVDLSDYLMGHQFEHLGL